MIYGIALVVVAFALVVFWLNRPERRVEPPKPATWADKAEAFQAEVAAAKRRLAAAAPPTACAFADCDDEVASTMVEVSGAVTGLCASHARRWPRMDEDERRAARMGT